MIFMTEAKRKRIISVLITTPTRSEACKILGITERTLYNYMQDDTFRAEYKEVVSCIINETEAKTKEAGLKAINHLMSVIDNPQVDELTKIKADRLILDHLTKMIECNSKYW